MKTKFLLVYFFFKFTAESFGQADTIQRSPFSMSAYLDFYYAYDFNDPSSKNRATLANSSSHVFSHHRHNEMTLNNGIIFLTYVDSKTRGALSIHAGTYVNANYKKEHGVLKNIYEAYAGFKLANYIWADAGIFTSHLGVESAISMYNYTLSRSIMADNTPYYESGAKISYSKNEKLTLRILLLNGWQNITENNHNKAIGTQIQIKPLATILFNSSTFIGKESHAYDTISTMRYFHNFYSEIILRKLKIIAAFDIGFQKRPTGENFDSWYNPLLLLRYQLLKKIALAGRIEYYHDKKGIIIHPGTPYGFQTFSPSLNIDYQVAENLWWRIEGRIFHSKYPVYKKGENFVRDNSFLLTSISFKMK